MIIKNKFSFKWSTIIILIVIFSFLFFYSYSDLPYIISFLRENFLENFNKNIDNELLLSLFEEIINIVVGIIIIIFNSFFRIINNDNGSSDDDMDYNTENSQNNGYTSDIDSDQESLAAYDSSNSSDPLNDILIVHNNMDAFNALEFHHINETGPIEVRISAFNTETTTITQDDLNHIRAGGDISVNIDGENYIITSDYRGQIRCLTEHADNTGSIYFENEAGYSTDIDESEGEE
jgi:hypothetical protein